MKVKVLAPMFTPNGLVKRGDIIEIDNPENLPVEVIEEKKKPTKTKKG